MGACTRTQCTELSLKQVKEDEAKITTKWFRITGRHSNFWVTQTVLHADTKMTK